MPQQVEIISTGDGGVIERMTPLQAQPAISVPAADASPSLVPRVTPILDFQPHQ
jgi:hypothetical protein